MSQPLYTDRLLSLYHSGATPQTAVVPVGERWVIRTALAVATSAAVGTVQLYSDAGHFLLEGTGTTSARARAEFEGYLVLHQGDDLAVAVVGAIAAWFHVSGYRLQS